MTKKIVRIGGAAGYWGDSYGGAAQLVDKGAVDYLVFDYLAEVTMSILAKARSRSENAGYATDFVSGILKPLLPKLAAKGIRVVANAGGVNLRACQAAIQKLTEEAGISLKIGIVEGDNLLDRDAEFRAAGVTEMFTGASFPPQTASINAYLGAFPVAAALAAGADIVITGRVVDSAVTLGPLIHEFGWQPGDYDRLAAGTLAGHLIECGCQVTGGNFTDWQLVADQWHDMGYPIAECAADGSFVITKAEGTGGLVSLHTVGEQMLYEIGDPQAYIVPDVVCDFASVTMQQLAEHRVRVSGARGYPPTSTYKVCSTYPDGHRATCLQTITGFDAEAKAQQMGESILARCSRMLAEHGWADFRKTQIDLLGANTLWNPTEVKRQTPSSEVVLSISAYHDAPEAVDLFSRETMGCALSMAAGRCGAGATGRPRVSPVVRLFSFLLDKNSVPVNVAVDGHNIELPDTGTKAVFADHMQVMLTPLPVQEANEGFVEMVPLLKLAVARSGDKGEDANIGVIARKPEYLPYIMAALTPQRVSEWFSHVLAGDVIRYELPGINALNFVLKNALGEGGVASLNIDVQGKTYGQQILAMPVAIPGEFN